MPYFLLPIIFGVSAFSAAVLITIIIPTITSRPISKGHVMVKVEQTVDLNDALLGGVIGQLAQRHLNSLTMSEVLVHVDSRRRKRRIYFREYPQGG